ncbi:SDR family NAD(P)-dependent oxidoreductase [Halomonas urumqiensis]|uniref:Short-chain dehydrogenase n=1 Tax=Halomonas urumqiensis TaxID=1684789 RepID=A0A2N7UI48_9GAMM|nr:SDR family NAD(P)-dependent oxidoreductase [Halomonas urumqiensis]PMR80101.1 short-chain dehydrogenase [Halomonas urumqiensis]PTB01264.1 KR domain-containing protein [Halomonas urumqiensis]GHE22634.1 short-chain dehydrogenase [Halomonas urumqiensis]
MSAANSPKQRIWLTGATSGIGRALALRLLDQGHQVALSARSEEALETLAAGRDNALILPLDVADREAVRCCGDTLAERFGSLDLAILNAGTCEYLDAGHFDVDLVERVFAPNFFGTLYCVDAALPLLRQARGEGRKPLLAATSSASAYLAFPRAEAYGASKAALSYFLESLRLDLHGEGIAISLIHPGFVKTPLTDRNDFAMPMRVTAEQAADAILSGLAKRRLDIHFPRRFTLLVKLAGILPPGLRLRLGLRMTRDTGAPDHASESSS